MSLFIRRTLLLVAAATLLVASQAVALAGLAQDIYVDINGANAPSNTSGTYSGPAPGGTGTWNGLTILDFGGGSGVNGTWTGQNNNVQTPTGPFVFADGSTASGLSIQTSGFVSADDQTAGPNKLLNDYLVQTSPGTLTVSGLTNHVYNVFLYGSNNGGNAGATFTVNGSASQGTSGAPYGLTAPFVLDRDYVEFTGVVATGGVLTIIAGDGGTLGAVGVFNGFQLVAVPEPGTFGLLAIALVAAAAARRRLSKSHR